MLRTFSFITNVPPWTRLLVVGDDDEITGVTRICASVHVTRPVVEALGDATADGDGGLAETGPLGGTLTGALASADGLVTPAGTLNPEVTVGLGLWSVEALDVLGPEHA